MNHKLLFISGIFFLLIIMIVSFFWLNNYVYNQKQGDLGFQLGYKDISYIIDDKSVTLVNGYSETESISGSNAKVITKYFGNEAEGDINTDGISDIVFLLTQESGGSGTFYYAVAALKTNTGYQGTNAMLLGDRIAPQTTEIKEGIIIVNYADRKLGEPMTENPSVGVSKYLKIENGVLTEKSVMPNFGFPQKLLIGASITLMDGLTVRLIKIDDSRCKQGMVCIWAGELSPLLNITGGNLGVSQKEVRLGTTNNVKVSSDGYSFELKDATETSATVIITRGPVVSGGCYIGGCSGQICSDSKDVVSTCEYKEEYACYKTAKCERQTNNQCGWTQTTELTACLTTAN